MLDPVDEYELSLAVEELQNTFRQKLADYELSTKIVRGAEYHAGFQSISKLKGALDLAESVGDDTVTFFDVHNVGHTMHVRIARRVLEALGKSYQDIFAKKQRKMTEAAACRNLKELRSVTW